MKDAIGQEIQVGDDVAHIKRRGSSVTVTRQRIATIVEEQFDEPFLTFDTKRVRAVMPWNVVKVAGGAS